jgi:hypothetical protein
MTKRCRPRCLRRPQPNADSAAAQRHVCFQGGQSSGRFCRFLEMVQPIPAASHTVSFNLIILPFSTRYSPRDFTCDQLEHDETDHIERDDSGDVILTLGDMSLYGMDVPAGAGAALCDFTITTESHFSASVPRIRGRIRYVTCAKMTEAHPKMSLTHDTACACWRQATCGRSRLAKLPMLFTYVCERYTTWCESKPVAAANQKSIFDAVKEAEMVCRFQR